MTIGCIETVHVQRRRRLSGQHEHLRLRIQLDRQGMQWVACHVALMLTWHKVGEFHCHVYGLRAEIRSAVRYARMQSMMASKQISITSSKYLFLGTSLHRSSTVHNAMNQRRHEITEITVSTHGIYFFLLSGCILTYVFSKMLRGVWK